MNGSSRKQYDHLIKLIIIGDSSVGKSCILLRFSEDQFPTSHMPTIGKYFCERDSAGIDFKIKTINVLNQRVKLQVWDTAGQERFRTITQTYYKGAMGIILVYDVTQEPTFNNITNWLKQIDSHASEDVARVLVANKIDLPNRVVSKEQGEQLGQQYGLTYFETSALTGVNINELFYHLAQQIIKDKPQVTSVVSTVNSTRATTNNSTYSQGNNYPQSDNNRVGANGIQLTSAQSNQQQQNEQNAGVCC